MGNLNIFENKIYFIYDNGKKDCLLDLSDFLSNRSHIPLHSLANIDFETIPDLIKKIIEICDLPENEIKGIDGSMLILTSIMIIKKYMYRAKGNNILEIGCTHGILSYFIGIIINFFGKSNLHCVSDVISSEGESDWLNNIMLLENSDNISITYTNYNNIDLRDSFYDITVINGYDYFENPEDVIRNAVRMTKENGLIVCIGKEQPFLSDMFQKIIDDCDVYSFDNNNIILTKLLDDKDKSGVISDTNENRLEKIREDFADLENKIAKIDTLDEIILDNIISDVSKFQNQILKLYEHMNNIYIKFELSELKEALINYRIVKNNAEQNLNEYVDRCKEKYFKVKII